MPGRTYPDPNSPNEPYETHNQQQLELDDDRFAEHAADAPYLSAQLEEIRPDEFPTYFSEHDDRLFPSASSLTPYPLPVDTPEQERVTLLHDILKRFIGEYYVGPVPDVLAPETGRSKMTLDLCTGNGRWVLDMAREFPHVHFRGIDIVPIATRYPPPRVLFEIYDMNSPYRWRDCTFDLVHARSVSMAVRDYPSILQEIARVLRQGGLFVSCEWGRHAAFDPSFQHVPSVVAPATVRFFNSINTALVFRRGIQPIADQIPTFLTNSGCFTDITVEKKYVPVGVWPSDLALQNIGADHLKAHEKYADSSKPLLREDGWMEADLERLITDYIQEIHNVSGLVAVLHTVHARKI